MKYDHLGEATDRLQGTVVRYEGEPVYISNISSSFNASFYSLEDLLKVETRGESASYRRRPLNDPLFDFKSVPLGYVNYGDNALYTVRVPARRYRQGVDERGLAVISEGTSRGIGVNRTLLLSLSDTISGKYPDFKQSLKSVREGRVNSRAFDRELAIQNIEGSQRFMYKGSNVGYVGKRSSKVYLASRFKFLKEFVESKGLTLGGRK